MTLTEFLLARIAEDEAAARKDEPWLWTDDENRPIPDAELALVSGVDLRMEVPVSRWLAECEAKRRIVAEHPASTEWAEGVNACTTCQWDIDCDAPKHDHQPGAGPYPCPTLRILALPYADHPDYQQEWRP